LSLKKQNNRRCGVGYKNNVEGVTCLQNSVPKNLCWKGPAEISPRETVIREMQGKQEPVLQGVMVVLKETTSVRIPSYFLHHTPETEQRNIAVFTLQN
jgi:hypothetical protein